MAISSAGIGSGLEVGSIVSQLVASERAAADNRLGGALASTRTRISALGAFKAALANLQTAAKALTESGSLGKPKVAVSDTALFTASATAAAPLGSYSIQVEALATASRQVSGTFANAATPLGAGSVAISVGGKSFSVELLSGQDTLAELRDAINRASDNSGVSASLINESGGVRLMLSGTRTGAANSVSINSSLLSMSQTQAAQDAHIKVEGYDVYSAGNTITGALEGVTLNLLKADSGKSAQVSMSADNAAAQSAVQGFITGYNSAVTLITSLTRYDADSGSAGALNGDALARQAMQQLRTVMGSTVEGGGDFSFLSQIGIKSNADGTLALDSVKFGEALNQNMNGVVALFSGDKGYARRLDEVIGKLVAEDGGIGIRVDSLNSRVTDIEKQQQALDLRMSRVQARYLAQFTALDTLMARMQTTSSYLTQQLAALARSS